MAIQLFVPTFDVENCLSEIRECLEKGWTGMGFKTVEFEEKWKQYTSMPNAYYLASATAGLNLTFDILKEGYCWQDGDEVITTPMTFISSNHAILLANLKPVFADIDDTLCLDPESVRSHITEKTKAVLYVGLGGNTGKYEEIVKICKENNLKLVLDAAHMAGTRLHGEIPGREAEAVNYSFQAVKNLPTADSGMLCFKEERFDKIARRKAWLGINKDTYSRSTGGNYKWRYDVEYVGNKYHGNSVVAAIGIAQLPHLDKDNAYRRQIASWYDQLLMPHKDKITFITIPEGCESARHLYQIMIDDRDGLMAYLNEHEIYPGVHYVDNTQYRMYAYAAGTCPKASYASDHLLSLPMHMRLTYEDIKNIAGCIIDYLNK